MDPTFSKSMLSAAAAGLMLGALSGCTQPGGRAESPKSGGHAAAPEPSTSDDGKSAANAAAGEGKACCKGMNECRGKGACKTDANECAGKNECQGKGGCNGHCPK